MYVVYKLQDGTYETGEDNNGGLQPRERAT